MGGGLTSVASWLVAASVQHRRGVLVAWLAFAVLFGLAGLRLRVDSSTSLFLDTTSPAWRTYQELLDRHGGDEIITIAYRTGRPLDKQLLGRIRHLTQSLERIRGVRRVDSLASFPLIRRASDGALDLTPPLGDGEVASASSILADRLLPGIVVSRDLRTAAINVVLDEDVTGDRKELVEQVRSLAGTDAMISGVPIFRTQINDDTIAETKRFLPATLVLVAASMALVLRSWVGILVALLCGGVGCIAVLGSMAIVGAKLSLSTMILPSILLALGSAYSMHVVEAAKAARDVPGALVLWRRVAPGVALSCVTTVLGFGAIGATSIRAIRDLGLFGALGVVSIGLSALTLCPALLCYRGFGRRITRLHSWMQVSLSRHTVNLVTRHGFLVVLGWLAFGVVGVWGALELTVSSDIIRWYGPKTQIRRDYDEIRRDLSGISPVSVLLSSMDGGSVVSPESLRAQQGLANMLEASPAVGRALSIADPLLMVSGVLRTDGARVLPDNADTVEQYLLLLEGERRIRDLLADDHQSASVLLRVDDNGSKAIVDLGRLVRQWWQANGPPGIRARVTGIMYQFASGQEAISRSQVRGLAIAVVGVACILWVVLGSLRLAFVGLVPNVLPIVAAYGFMGFAGIPIDAATVCLGALALGIAVDDTIHIMLALRRRRGQPFADGLEACLRDHGTALATSSLAIGAGFAVLGSSEFVLVRNLGLLTAGVVVVCWAADMTLLPTLIRLLGSPRGGAKAAR